MQYDYGNWLLALANIIIFLFFIKSAFKPRTKTDWKTYKTFGAFIVALFAEMYGFPLTIYLLTITFGSRIPQLNFSHKSGHLLDTLLGFTGDPHFSLFHIVSFGLIISGLFMIASAWKILYRVKIAHTLAQTGLYKYIRHPQYVGFVLIIIGFLLQWPTFITLLMAPILISRYIYLAKKEEKVMMRKFGSLYRSYRTKTPAFIPWSFN